MRFELKKLIRITSLRTDKQMQTDGFQAVKRTIDPVPMDRAIRLVEFFEASVLRQPGSIALVCDGTNYTYQELDHAANQLAHYLIFVGISPLDSVGILLDRSLNTYVTLLGILKAGAAFVPIDPSFPHDRISFIAKDADLTALITLSSRAAELGDCSCQLISIDKISLLSYPTTKPQIDSSKSIPVDQSDADLCYVIYTSGTSGRPKGVAVSHGNIGNFLRSCGQIYQYRPTDRVYQGMTIAFDFSIEEIWPTWAAGAAVVAGPNDHRRLGAELGEFLTDQNITVFCCVPTLLSTIEKDVPSLRLILVGGEACPAHLVSKWHRPARTILNTYGPTETTVTATWTQLFPDKPVTIGKPLPTYTVHILDDQQRPVPVGETGEICIGGPGVAIGYINRPDLTADRFIPNTYDPVLDRSITNDPKHADLLRQQLSSTSAEPRLYRSGDLGRYTAEREIEFLGRIDGQVKIRGYRIEPAEIEAVMLENPELENAVVNCVSVGDPGTETKIEMLAAYITLRSGNIDTTLLRRRIHDTLHRNLPAYMVPSYIEILPAMPRLASGKIDRSKLPHPSSEQLSRTLETHHAQSHSEPATELEKQLARLWEKTLGRSGISAEANFFNDLGGHSLFAAGLISQLRQSAGYRFLSISHLYSHPTIRSLASYIQSITTDSSASKNNLSDATPNSPESNTKSQPVASPTSNRLKHSSTRVFFAGLTQMAMIYTVFLLFAVPTAIQFTSDPSHSLKKSLHSALIYGPIGMAIILAVLPMAFKSLFIGTFRPGQYPLWGWFYCRFWLFRKLMAFSPIHVVAGSPLLPGYLRYLGAKIGRNCDIATGSIELPDLIQIGNNVSIGYGTQLQTYYIKNGYLHLGNIQIENDVHIGANAVIMPGVQIGAAAIITDLSLIARNEKIGIAEIWTGSPATHRTATPDLFKTIADAASTHSNQSQAWSPFHLVLFALGSLIIEAMPLLFLMPGMWVLDVAIEKYDIGYGTSLLAAIPAGLLYILTVCTFVALAKRIIGRAKPGVFPVRSYAGVRKWFTDRLMELSLASTNSLYATLYSLPWLRLLGARIGRRSEVSTVSHIDPDLLSIGDECFVADDASVGGATYYKGMIYLGKTELTSRCFVGNSSLVPANTHLGENSLLGVLSIPPSSKVDAGTSWLGSPAICLPRRQIIDTFDESLTYRPAKRLVALRLAIEFMRVTLPAILMSLLLFTNILITLDLAESFNATALSLLLPLIYIATSSCIVAIVIALKWIVVGKYKPLITPNWSHFVWRTEFITGVYESAAVPALLDWLTATPLLPVVLRFFGAGFAKRVYLESTYLTEFDLVQVGDDTEIGSNTSLQTHLFEDRVMKMSVVTIGSRCTIGTRSVVLYDSILEDGVQLDALSLAMKGESLPADTEWRGIPAQSVE